mmetsp:Transcript_58517/g.105424  ORF Transcript_58517/g.105424 Transcript_58517/m.105424 type:complete len:110 (-) Transcript_58517:250-579(-)
MGGRRGSELLAEEEQMAGGALNRPAAALPTGHGEAAEELAPPSRPGPGMAFTGTLDVAESPGSCGSDSDGTSSARSLSTSGGDLISSVLEGGNGSIGGSRSARGGAMTR